MIANSNGKHFNKRRTLGSSLGRPRLLRIERLEVRFVFASCTVGFQAIGDYAVNTILDESIIVDGIPQPECDHQFLRDSQQFGTIRSNLTTGTVGTRYAPDTLQLDLSNAARNGYGPTSQFNVFATVNVDGSSLGIKGSGPGAIGGIVQSVVPTVNGISFVVTGEISSPIGNLGTFRYEATAQFDEGFQQASENVRITVVLDSALHPDLALNIGRLNSNFLSQFQLPSGVMVDTGDMSSATFIVGTDAPTRLSAIESEWTPSPLRTGHAPTDRSTTVTYIQSGSVNVSDPITPIRKPDVELEIRSLDEATTMILAGTWDQNAKGFKDDNVSIAALVLPANTTATSFSFSYSSIWTPPETASVSVEDLEIGEGDQGAKHIRIPITLNHATPEPFDVQLVAHPSSQPADEGIDFRLVSPTTLSFEGTRGEVQFVELEVVGDSVREGDETIGFRIATISTAFVNAVRRDFTITLHDDDEFDMTPPIITAPESIILEANTRGGASVDTAEIVAFLSSAEATDNIDANPTIIHNAPAFISLGSTVVTFTATDAMGNASTDTATITVIDTTPPMISNIAGISVNVNASIQPILFFVSDLVTAPQELVITATSSDTTVIAASDIVLGGIGDDRTIRLTPTGGKVGSTTMTVTVTDGSRLTSSARFNVEIIAEPEFSIQVSPNRSDDPADLASGIQPTSWNIQRSMMREIEISLPAPINAVSASDIALTNLGVDASMDPDTVVSIANRQVSLSANGRMISVSLVDSELKDGVYQLALFAAITGSATRTITGNSSNKLFVLRGDWNGSGSVNIQDFATFAYWFGQSAPTAPQYVDTNQSGGINIQDFAGFAANFGKEIVFPITSAATNLGRVGEVAEAHLTTQAIFSPPSTFRHRSPTTPDALHLISRPLPESDDKDVFWARYHDMQEPDDTPCKVLGMLSAPDVLDDVTVDQDWLWTNIDVAIESEF